MSVEEHMLAVKAEIAALKKINPKLTFRRAWDKVRAISPELFEEGRVEAEQPSEVEIEAQRAKQASWGTFEVQCISPVSNIWTGEAVDVYETDPWYHS